VALVQRDELDPAGFDSDNLLAVVAVRIVDEGRGGGHGRHNGTPSPPRHQRLATGTKKQRGGNTASYRDFMIAGRSVVVAGLAGLLTLTACTAAPKTGPARTVTVVVTPTPSSAATSRSATPTATPTVASMSKLPGECDGLLPAGSVEDAIGGPVKGDTDFVVGLPDPSIGRVGYINCQYGLASKTAPPEIVIQVSLYRTPAKAEARVQPTVEDYTQHGAQATQTVVDGHPATVLLGGTGAEYGPTLVMALGQRTVAVSLAQNAVPASDATKDLTALAALAVRRTSA
jgi:hypothetical protein